MEMHPTAIMMQEVQVSAKIPRFTMSGDTIVFHPEAFNLPEGARLSELIRKLPGVQERDGGLYWNDKPLRMMMNGKNIFGSSGIVNQLPAEVAGKIKLYDRKSEESRHTGKNEGEEDNVLDISVKPGYLDKWYGNVLAGGMTGSHYKGELNANYLSDSDPWLVYGQMNNENKYMNRYATWMSYGDISSYGKSQYGSVSRQHNWQPKGTEKFSSSYLWGTVSLPHEDGWYGREGIKQTFVPGQEKTKEDYTQKNYNHSFVPELAGGMYAYVDSVNMVYIDFEAKYRDSWYNTEKTSSSFGGGDGSNLVSRQSTFNNGKTKAGDISARLKWTRYVGKKGSYGVSSNYSFMTQTQRNSYNRELTYERLDSTSNLYQYLRMPSSTFNAVVSPYIKLWLNDNVYVNVSDRICFYWHHANRSFFADTEKALLYDDLPVTEDHDNYMRNVGHDWSNNLTVSLTVKVAKDLRLVPSLSWMLKRERTSYRYGSLDTVAVRHSSFLMPKMSVKWNFDRVRKLNIDFNYNTKNPDLAQTFDYVDTTDPLYTSVGNSYLKRSHNYVVKGSYIRMWPRRQTMLNLMASYNRDINPLSTLYVYDAETAAYTSMPVNIKGGDKYSLGIDYDQGIGFYMRLTNRLNANWKKSYGYLALTSADDEPTLNRQRNFSMTNNAELSYETERVSMSLYNNLTCNRYRNSAYSDANSSPLQMRYGAKARVKPGNFEIYADVYDDFRTGYLMSAMNGRRWIADAGASWRLCKSTLLLSIDANDIFNRLRTRWATYTSYSMQEETSDYLHHYLAFSVKYTFDAKGKGHRRGVYNL